MIFLRFLIYLADRCRFGWVNASYVYGLQHIDAFCTRALGTLSTWEQVSKQRATIFERDEMHDEEGTEKISE